MFVRQQQVHTLKKKVMVFLIVLVLFIARPTLRWAYDDYALKKEEGAKKQQELAVKTQQQQTILKDVQILSSATSPLQKANLMNCYNTNCPTLPELVREEPVKSIFKAYLQLQNTTETNFTIDQKRVLSYLNEFLVKWPSGVANWEIREITFSAPKDTQLEQLQAIPMTVTMRFANKQGLLLFLRNIENVLSPNYPMLAIVNSVSYDVVKSDTQQDVQIAMTLYMIKQK